MARLTDIATEIARVIKSITTTAGYEVTFGSVNEADEALIKYPSCEITYTTEQPDTSEVNNLYGYAITEFQIKVRSKLNTVETAPIWAIDAEYDKAIGALKKIFGGDNGALALEYNPVIMYAGFEKENYKNGDVFVPGAVITRWMVKYQYSE